MPLLRKCGDGCGQIPPISKINHAAHGYKKGKQLKFMPGHNNHGPKLSTPRKRARWVNKNCAGKSKSEIWDRMVEAGLLSRTTQFEDIGFSRLMRTLDARAI